jgi:hypothetical protein
MKTKLYSIFAACTVLASTNSYGVTLTGSIIANSTVGLITLDGDNIAPFPTGSPNNIYNRAAVSGRAIIVSVTNALNAANVKSSMESLLSSTTSTGSNFDSALSTLITAVNTVAPSTNPGVVRSANFTSGVITSAVSSQYGDATNKTYLFLVAENAGFVTGIGAYTGSNVPATGSLTFNPAFCGDTLGVGTSVLTAASGGQPISGFQLAAAVPEPSAALLGALGALGLLRRRRN